MDQDKFRTAYQKSIIEMQGLRDRSTLTDLNKQFQRNELIIDHKRQELESMSSEARRIQENAHYLSTQLIQEVNL